MEQFELDGESPDLEDMVRLFSTGSRTVKKIAGRYYLQLAELELPTGNTQVPEAAQEALSVLNGIARLELGTFRPAKILGFSKIDPNTGNLQTYMSLGGKCEGRARSYGTVTIRLSDGTIVTTQEPTYVDTVSQLADKNKPFKHALTLFGRERQHDWISLYNVLDAITQALGGPQKLIEQEFVTESEIEDFKENAKPHRHGFTECKPRNRKRKEPIRQKKEMTLAEAQAWI